MKRSGFRTQEVNHGCYFKKLSSSYIIFVLNIDDMVIVSSNTQKINKLNMWLTREFKTMNQGATKKKKVLSMENLADEYTKVFTTKKLKLGMASAALPRC